MKNSINDLVSIITVAYNSEKTIRDTIESVLKQSCTNFEYIIIDGNSNDNTRNIIKSYENSFAQKNIAFKWISETDQGIYDAMNKGVILASGELIAFINSDDWYDKNTVKKVLDVFKKFDDIDLLYGNMTMIKENESEHILKKPKPMQKLYKEQNIYFPSVFIKKEILKDSNPAFDLKYNLAADYKFLLKSFLNSRKFYYLDENLAFYRLGGSTTQQIKKSWNEVKSIQLELGRNKFLVEINYCEKIAKRAILKAIKKL